MSKISNASCPESLNFDLKVLGEDKIVNLCDTYLGKVILVVNTASKCGFTPQYEGLEKLYQENKDKGFVVLGFPSHDFDRSVVVKGHFDIGGLAVIVVEFRTP